MTPNGTTPDLLISKTLNGKIERFLRQPSHAVAIVGQIGAGKAYLARYIAASVLDITPQKLDHYPYFCRLAPEKGVIKIDMSRQLAHFMQLKTAGQGKIRRVAFIEDAAAMNTEAQNALLKTLEEPPADTMIILTITARRQMLPTIISRIQLINFDAPSQDECRQFFVAKNYKPALVQKAYALSGGLPGLMASLLHGDKSHPLVAAIEQAKDFLRCSEFERLCRVDSIAKDRQNCVELLGALQRIARAGLFGSASKENHADAARWHKIFKASAAAEQAINQKANSKLAMTSFILSL